MARTFLLSFETHSCSYLTKMIDDYFRLGTTSGHVRNGGILPRWRQLAEATIIFLPTMALALTLVDLAHRGQLPIEIKILSERLVQATMDFLIIFSITTLQAASNSHGR